MAFLEGQTPKERKQMIAAAALGVVALIALWYAFFSSTPAKRPTSNTNNNRTTRLSPTPTIVNGSAQQASGTTEPEISLVGPVRFDITPAAVPEAGRNIFAYYVPPPKPTPDLSKLPTPTPTPTPPLMLASVSPANVYARTGDFTLDVSGDKFPIQARINIDGRELDTKYHGPQHLSSTVPAAVIASEGPRRVTVRTPDGQLYSNDATLNVSAPPAPQYSYVGMVGTPGYNDTAILKEKASSKLVNVQRGDTLSGRFRVTSISEREVALMDTSLRIKHTLPLTRDGDSNRGQPQQRIPTRPAEPENPDEEP
jgi:hypothetical protein